MYQPKTPTLETVILSPFHPTSPSSRPASAGFWPASHQPPDLPVVVTHLASSAANRHQRVRQLEGLLPWAASAHTAILMGDLNAPPQAPELVPVLARYRDAWAEAFPTGRHRRRTVRFDEAGTLVTHRLRADSPAAALTLQSVEVVEHLLLLHRTEASDHRPVVATFRRTAARQ